MTRTDARASAPGVGLRRVGALLWQWGPLAAAMVAIFVVSGQSQLPDLPGGMSDKTAHFLAWGGLGALALRATSGARWSGVTRSTGLVAWAICVVYAASDEFHQWFVPGRTAAADDWLADVAGSGLTIALLTFAARRRRAR